MDTHTDAVDKADSDAIQALVTVARDATGAFSDRADERLVVHATGRTAEYVPRDASQAVDKDPVLSWIESRTDARIKRHGIKRFSGGDVRPSVTVETDD